MKRISTLCLLLVVFFAIPICGPNSLAGKSAEPVLQADGPIPYPPLPPRPPQPPVAGQASLA